MKFRAFISADIVPSEALVAVLGRLDSSRADLKTVRPELMHLTLKFLGDAEESLIDEIVERMAKATDGVQPFRIRLKGMGAFPSLSVIKVVWVGIEDGGPLERIAQELDESMSELGFEREKRGFKAHLTLARTRSAKNIANVQDILKENAATDYGEYTVDRIFLKKSLLTPGGPIYSTVSEHLLGSVR